MYACMWWAPAQTHYQFVTWVICHRGRIVFSELIVSGGILFWGGLLYSFFFVLGGFCPWLLFHWGAYGPVAFVRGLFDGVLNLES